MTVMSHKIMNIITKYQFPEMSCLLQDLKKMIMLSVKYTAYD
jgi:hypothetical protein